MIPYIADWRRPTNVAVRDARALLESNHHIVCDWEKIGFRARPNPRLILEEFDELIGYLSAAHIGVELLREAAALSLDCLYTRDAVALTPNGLVACRMGKASRAAEPSCVSKELSFLGYAIHGSIEPPGKLEGGDVVWLDDQLCAIGLSYRTNLAGAQQFQSFCSPSVECIFVHLPHYCGSNVILHLSSILSVLTKEAILADTRYLSVQFVEFLLDRGFHIFSILDDERVTLGANVLQIGNDTLLSISGNARTQAMLTSEGFHVLSMRGENIGILGDGGPTCLTRPLSF